jgi:hypothetical protein
MIIPNLPIRAALFWLLFIQCWLFSNGRGSTSATTFSGVNRTSSAQRNTNQYSTTLRRSPN